MSWFTQKQSDKDLLIYTLMDAIFDVELQIERTPTREEIYNHLFPGSRGDPEAKDLERKLDGVLLGLLEEWELMSGWEEWETGTDLEAFVQEL